MLQAKQCLPSGVDHLVSKILHCVSLCHCQTVDPNHKQDLNCSICTVLYFLAFGPCWRSSTLLWPQEVSCLREPAEW